MQDWKLKVKGRMGHYFFFLIKHVKGHSFHFKIGIQNTPIRRSPRSGEHNLWHEAESSNLKIIPELEKNSQPHLGECNSKGQLPQGDPVWD